VYDGKSSSSLATAESGMLEGLVPRVVGSAYVGRNPLSSLSLLVVHCRVGDGLNWIDVCAEIVERGMHFGVARS
jgi:hypothetical protein